MYRNALIKAIINQFTTGIVNSPCPTPVNSLSHASLGNNPSRVRLDFRMLVRGKDGNPAGEEDIHCVGFFDHWMKKVSDNKRKGERFLSAADS